MTISDLCLGLIILILLILIPIGDFIFSFIINYIKRLLK